MNLKCAVLFDGAGLARLGLEQAGFECTGYEYDPVMVELGVYVGIGDVRFADVTKLKFDQYDIVWASPPCQYHSIARTQGLPNGHYTDDLLQWALRLSNPWLWVENVFHTKATWGTLWNAAQFTPLPLQNRTRMIGGRYITPKVYRPYRRYYPEASPAILASEYKGSKNDPRRASRNLGRRLTLEECALYQGFTIPARWYYYNQKTIYEAIGNGVPVYMARLFGEALYERLTL